MLHSAAANQHPSTGYAGGGYGQSSSYGSNPGAYQDNHNYDDRDRGGHGSNYDDRGIFADRSYESPRAVSQEMLLRSNQRGQGMPPSESGSYSLSRDYGNSHQQGHQRYGQQSHGQHQGYAEDFSAMAPRTDPRELFVNVTVTDIQEDNPVKHVKNWMGGMINLVNGGTQSGNNERVADNHFTENETEIQDEVYRVILNHGWDSEITLMLLPPSHGERRSAPYLQLTEDPLPFLMVLRVAITKRYRPHREDEGWLECCDCSEMMQAHHRPIDRQEYDSMGREIQDALRHLEVVDHTTRTRTRKSIRADISVVDAIGEWHVLHNMHWSEEQAAAAIMNSRTSAGADYDRDVPHGVGAQRQPMQMSGGHRVAPNSWH